MPAPSRESLLAQRERDRRAVRAAWPFLASSQDAPGVSSHALAARNARVLLKRVFPGERFFVSSQSYANGSSLDVSWHDPEGQRGQGSDFYRDVERTVGRFAYGQPDFGGDGYDYASGEAAAFCDVFGGVKYVHAGIRPLTQAQRAKLSQAALDRALPRTGKSTARRGGPRL